MLDWRAIWIFSGNYVSLWWPTILLVPADQRNYCFVTLLFFVRWSLWLSPTRRTDESKSSVLGRELVPFGGLDSPGQPGLYSKMLFLHYRKVWLSSDEAIILPKWPVEQCCKPDSRSSITFQGVLQFNEVQNEEYWCQTKPDLFERVQSRKGQWWLWHLLKYLWTRLPGVILSCSQFMLCFWILLLRSRVNCFKITGKGLIFFLSSWKTFEWSWKYRKVSKL